MTDANQQEWWKTAFSEPKPAKFTLPPVSSLLSLHIFQNNIRCMHNKERNNCKSCGNGTCIHGRVRSCEKCGNSNFCSHNKQNSQCSDCQGTAVCPHLKLKATCFQCSQFALSTSSVLPIPKINAIKKIFNPNLRSEKESRPIKPKLNFIKRSTALNSSDTDGNKSDGLCDDTTNSSLSATKASGEKVSGRFCVHSKRKVECLDCGYVCNKDQPARNATEKAFVSIKDDGMSAKIVKVQAFAIIINEEHVVRSAEAVVFVLYIAKNGIGKGLAISLAQRNYVVYATARKVDSLQSLTKEYSNIKGLRLDVCDQNTIKSAVDQIIQNEGRIDLLVNNAGISFESPAAETDLERVKLLFNTNVIGLIAVTNEVFPHMAKVNSGKIVNIGSVAGWLIAPFMSMYSATKAAVELYTDGLRVECKPFGIQVMLVTPGMVKSDICDHGNSYVKSNGYYEAFKAKFIGTFSFDEDKCKDKKLLKRVMDTKVFCEGLASAIDKKYMPFSYLDGGLSYIAYAFSFLPGWVKFKAMYNFNGFGATKVIKHT
ncbi:hypothetical protein HDU92_003496 [Lobulomyces angularis]|nr:hypothetical protein HDU92_003496 [Lobulomyces angularis]